MTAWKTQLLQNAAALFGGEASSGEDREKLRELHAKIGELTVERDFSYGLPGVKCPADDSRASDAIGIV